jgi:hypothetical protein
MQQTALTHYPRNIWTLLYATDHAEALCGVYSTSIIAAVTGFAIGIGYRYFWNDPSRASVANWRRGDGRRVACVLYPNAQGCLR